MDAPAFYKQLRALGQRRRQLEASRVDINERAAALLRQVSEVDGVTMLGAAEALGVSRKAAYDILKAGD